MDRSISINEIKGLIEELQSSGLKVTPDSFKQVEALKKDIDAARREMLEELAKTGEKADFGTKVTAGIMFDLLGNLDITPAERIVLEGVILESSKDGIYFGDTRTLAAACRVSQLTILRRIQSLQLKGLISSFSSTRGTLIEVSGDLMVGLTPYLEGAQP